MTSCKMLRKDAPPKETIKKIVQILRGKGINVKINQRIKSPFFNSCRIEIAGTHYGTNGKGVTEDSALASAYGEFMERLQTGFLMSATSKQLDLKEIPVSINEYENESLIGSVKKLFSSIYDIKDVSKLHQLISLMPQYKKMSEYFNILTNSIEMLPETFIKCFDGSNGLCAGNTPEEALCQGICEIFERIALKRFFAGDGTFPLIPREFYEDTESFNLLKFIESKNYLCIVKDLTLEGRIPVVGIVIIDPSRTKCQMGIGSDLNFDIALQRSITEVFQGKEFDLTYPMLMKPIYDLPVLDENLRKLNENSLPIELMKQLICGDGKIPLQVLFDLDETKRKHLNIFNHKLNKNKEVLSELIRIVKNNQYELYIKDFSIYGFPAYQVFIPDQSSLYLSMENAVIKIISANDLRDILKQECIDYYKFLECLHTINKNGAFSSDFDINCILGITYLKNIPSDTHLIEVLVLTHLERYEEAYETYREYFGHDMNSQYILLYLQALKNNQKIELAEFFNGMDNKNAIKEIDNFKEDLSNLNMLTCYKCEICPKIDICLYKTVKEIQIQAIKERSMYCTSRDEYIKILS